MDKLLNARQHVDDAVGCFCSVFLIKPVSGYDPSNQLTDEHTEYTRSYHVTDGRVSSLGLVPGRKLKRQKV